MVKSLDAGDSFLSALSVSGFPRIYALDDAESSKIVER